MNFLKRIKAKRMGLPPTLKNFWHPYYISFGGKSPNGATVLADVYKANIGEVVPVFKDGDRTHFYKLHEVSVTPGNDHIVSPLEFDLTYQKTA